MKNILPLLFLLALVGCASTDPKVRVTNDAPPQVVAPPKAAAQPMRTEPIFYNGKTYTLKFAPSQSGAYSMSVLGMGAKQQKDATAVATSSLRYFKCKDGQNGIVTSGPAYQASAWNMTVKCG